MVTGVALNETRTWTGWASYFLDHSEDLPSQTSSVLDIPPRHCSYARGPLLEAGGFPEGLCGGEEVTLNTELLNRGYLAYRDPGVKSSYRSSRRTLRQFAHHYFARGGSLGRILLEDNADRHGLLLNFGFLESRLLMYLPRRLKRIRQDVLRWGQLKHRMLYFWVLPLVVVGVVAAWLGMWCEILRPIAGKSPVLLGRPHLDLYSKLRHKWRDAEIRLRRARKTFLRGESSDEDLLVLVDRNNALPEDYVPWDLISLASYGIPTTRENLVLRQEAAKQLARLMRAAAAKGEKMIVTSAYRSFQYQRSLFAELVSIYGHDAADSMCALPGHSQHQLGTTVDFTNEDVDFKLEGSFGDTSAGQWLLRHANKYGFVLAYPKGGEAETGYQWEPWHYRYIGIENARRFRASGMSLQMFLLGEGVLPC
jgi:D-alanyl-D-alanine carboxypeptidase